MPSHTHRPTNGELSDSFITGGSSGIRGANITIGGSGYVVQQTTQSTGGGKAFYPSYRNVYAWYRTA